jgi:hypothetical protein
MNIFALDVDPKQAARWHVDKHVVKMPLECGQMLSTAIWVSWPEKELTKLIASGKAKVHKKSWENHPSSIWVRGSLANWLWLQALALHLLDEHKLRFGLDRVEYRAFITQLPYPRIPDIGLTEFSRAMPEWISQRNENSVEAYRDLYNNSKRHLLQWKCRSAPPWIVRAPYLSHKVQMKYIYPPTPC